jgi:TonB family protein
MFRVSAILLTVVSTTAVAQLTSVELAYPPAALKASHEGVVGFEVKLAKDGRVTGCRVTQTSGYTDLDQETCVQLRRTGRFKYAVDSSGKAVSSTYASKLRWRLPRLSPVAAPATSQPQ